MNVYELTRAQLTELKQNYMVELADEGSFAETMEVEFDCPSYGELADADEIISDDYIFGRYEGVEFTEDDFLCSSIA